MKPPLKLQAARKAPSSRNAKWKPVTLYGHADSFGAELREKKRYPDDILHFVLPLTAESYEAAKQTIAQAIANTYWGKKNAAIGFRDYQFARVALKALGITKPRPTSSGPVGSAVGGRK